MSVMKDKAKDILRRYEGKLFATECQTEIARKKILGKTTLTVGERKAWDAEYVLWRTTETGASTAAEVIAELGVMTEEEIEQYRETVREEIRKCGVHNG